MSSDFNDLRDAITRLCSKFPDEYWRKLDAQGDYPTEFVSALTEGGWLSVLIPEQYGGAGLPLSAGAAILEQIHAQGGNGAACHAQMYTMGTLLRHGSQEQKQRYLPKIASGELRLQAFGVTEPSSGTDTTALNTRAVKQGDTYVISGQKIWTSRAEHSGLSIQPIKTMMNHATTQVFFDDVTVSMSQRIGEEGQGFKYIMSGMNAERILIAAECIGDAKWFTNKSVSYAKSREVFGRPIGKNQGVQFPIAKAYANMKAAELMVHEALRLYQLEDGGDIHALGEAANTAKMLAADAANEAANVCIQTHGGFGFATDYDIERKFRETRLYQVAPISTNLILSYLSEHILGMPRSY